MLSFAAPFFLLALVGLPLIRGLHRGGLHRRAVPVSWLGLWRGDAISPPAAGERRPPDPAWRRRALLAALLVVALAEPQWPGQRHRITLWIDDSPSMRTRESQGTRLALALAQARELLAGVAGAEVEWRTLGDPWHAVPLQALAEGGFGAATGPVPGPPPAALLRSDRQHWLLTDGAHEALFDWPGPRRPDRVVQVAGVTRNVGIERLAARRTLSDGGGYELLVKLSNGGSAEETRELVVTAEGGEPLRSSHRLAPGQSVTVQPHIPAASQVRARLLPGDALAEDDELALDLGPLRRRSVAVDARCPAAWLAAVTAHPALALAPASGEGAAAVLDCGTPAAPQGLPTIRVRADRTPSGLAGPVRWSAAIAESQRQRLDASRLRAAARLQPGPGDEVLLAVGEEPVIVSQAGAGPRLETSLDFAAAASAGTPEVPLLAGFMFDRLLGGPLLDAIAIADRGPGAARVVAMKPPDQASEAKAAPPAGPPRDATRPLLLAAWLVLLWEVVALARQWLRLKGPGEARGP